jgi:multidrug resistance efflux pump
MTAPEDGRIVNLQVRPGMVSGIVRIGGIAALIADADRYVLATYYQENLKYVRPGQPVEVAFDLYPGQIFSGKVDSIWRANGVGQYLPSDEIPKFAPPPPTIPQGQYAVKILIDDPDQSKFPIGAQGVAAIYLGGAAQDLDPRPFVGQLALSDQFLIRSGADTGYFQMRPNRSQTPAALLYSSLFD